MVGGAFWLASFRRFAPANLWQNSRSTCVIPSAAQRGRVLDDAQAATDSVSCVVTNMLVGISKNNPFGWLPSELQPRVKDVYTTSLGRGDGLSI